MCELCARAHTFNVENMLQHTLAAYESFHNLSAPQTNTPGSIRDTHHRDRRHRVVWATRVAFVCACARVRTNVHTCTIYKYLCARVASFAHTRTHVNIRVRSVRASPFARSAACQVWCVRVFLFLMYARNRTTLIRPPRTRVLMRTRPLLIMEFGAHHRSPDGGKEYRRLCAASVFVCVALQKKINSKHPLVGALLGKHARTYEAMYYLAVPHTYTKWGVQKNAL